MLSFMFIRCCCRQSARACNLRNADTSPVVNTEYVLTLNWTASDASSALGRLLKMLIMSMLCSIHSMREGVHAVIPV